MKTCDECENAEWNGMTGRCRIAKEWKPNQLPECMEWIGPKKEGPTPFEYQIKKGQKLPRHCPYYKPVAKG